MSMKPAPLLAMILLKANIPRQRPFIVQKALPGRNFQVIHLAVRKFYVTAAGFRKERYVSSYWVSNVFQKTGFFPGAHGIPDVSRLQDDGDSRNIELPYSRTISVQRKSCK